MSALGALRDLAKLAAGRGVRAVLLDMDGTLVDYGVDYELGRARAIRRIAVEVVGGQGLNLDARSAREIIARVREALGAEAAEAARRIIFEEYEELELEAASKVGLRPGAAEALREMRANGYRLALVTNNSRRATEIVLRRFPEVAGYLDAVVTRDDSGELKPGTAGLLMALGALHLSGREAIMVGDTPSDMRAGKGVGAIAVGVEGGAASAETLLEAGADFVVGSLGDLSRALAMARRPVYLGDRSIG